MICKNFLAAKFHLYPNHNSRINRETLADSSHLARTQTYPCDSVVSRLLWVWFCYQQLFHWALQHCQSGNRQQLRLNQKQQAERINDIFWLIHRETFCDSTYRRQKDYLTSLYKIPEWIRGSAGGPTGPLAPTQQGLFYDSGWRNGSQPSLLLDHKAHPGHLPPSQAGPSLLLPKKGYRTGHLDRKKTFLIKLFTPIYL